MTPNSPDGTFFAECAGFLVVKPPEIGGGAEVCTKGFRVAHAAGAPQTAKNCAAKAAERLTQALSLGLDESW
jgi:hypothetical protein